MVITGAEDGTTNTSTDALLVRPSFITTTVILVVEATASNDAIQFVVSSAEDAREIFKVGRIMQGGLVAERDLAEQLHRNRRPAAAPVIPMGKSGSVLCDASAENTFPNLIDCNDPPKIVAHRSDCTTDTTTDAEAELLEPVSATVSWMI